MSTRIKRNVRTLKLLQIVNKELQDNFLIFGLLENFSVAQQGFRHLLSAVLGNNNAG